MGDVQFTQSVAIVAVEAKHACTGNTQAITKANKMPVANSRLCFCRARFTVTCPKSSPKQ